MSKYSGKCDFADHVEVFGLENVLNNSDIYLGWNIIPLKMTCEKDLVPYYPYLVIMSTYGGGRRIVRLSSISFVDEEEKEVLDWRLNSLLRYYNRCKRNHVPYVVEEALQSVWGDWYKPEYAEELAERVRACGKKADTDGLHIPSHQYYRKQLYEEMVRQGYEEGQAWFWVYKEFKRE